MSSPDRPRTLQRPSRIRCSQTITRPTGAAEFAPGCIRRRDPPVTPRRGRLPRRPEQQCACQAASLETAPDPLRKVGMSARSMPAERAAKRTLMSSQPPFSIRAFLRSQEALLVHFNTPMSTRHPSCYPADLEDAKTIVGQPLSFCTIQKNDRGPWQGGPPADANAAGSVGLVIDVNDIVRW
jgi:hypothetical protein